MTVVNLMSIGIQDYVGGRKTIPLFMPNDVDLAGAQALFDTTAPLLDPTIDAKIMDATVTLGLTLPGGLKSAPVTGNTVHEGALLSYNAEDTIYTLATFIGSWKNAGFSGNAVTDTGAYHSLILDLQQYLDKYGNALESFILGRRKFRK